MTTKWVKLPSPGQFRGEGTWVDASEHFSPSELEAIETSGYLPIKISKEQPKD